MGNQTFDDTSPDLHADIERNGFADTLGRRLTELAAAHKEGRSDLLEADLACLLERDPGIDVPSPDAPGPALQGNGLHDDFVEEVRGRLRQAKGGIPGVVERDGSPVKVLMDEQFRNWGGTVDNVPAVTAIPMTRTGICNLVKWASSTDKRVRVAGYRHTWGNLFAATGEVLISTLPLDVATELPASEPGIDPASELQGIEIVGTIEEDGAQKALCRIGAGTTNEQFRRWCLDAEGGALEWTVPLNVIMVEITWGGSNAPICHGAGLRNRTLSDLVAEIEFVNPKGELQTVSDADQLKAASGAFGLMGVVTAVTLKLDRMTYARMKPERKRVALTVPPPEGFDVPAGVDMSGVSRADLQGAERDFVARAETAYYAEWFWFTFEPDCWINTWHNDGDAAQSSDYPGPLASDIQAGEEYLAGLVAESRLYNLLPEVLQAEILAKGAMGLMPSGRTIVTPLIDGLHFRRGIQNMRVFDMEWEIPIPALPDGTGKPDWSVCQRAWWDAIAEVYRWKAMDKAPMRLTLEMRVMGGSGVTMAPQFGNDLGTCSIEVLTTINTDRTDWNQFKQNVTDRWTAITDGQGRRLNTRPHWAKEWQGLTVDGQAITDYLRDSAYRDRIPEFRAALQDIARDGGYTLADLKRLYSNDSLSAVLGGIYD